MIESATVIEDLLKHIENLEIRNVELEDALTCIRAIEKELGIDLSVIGYGCKGKKFVVGKIKEIIKNNGYLNKENKRLEDIIQHLLDNNKNNL